MKSTLGKLAMMSAMLGDIHTITNPYAGMDSPGGGGRYGRREYGPGDNQAKRRKLGRQNPHSKYAK